jgi:hypothetical protein
MKKKIETGSRKAAHTLLNQYCVFSVGERKDKGDFIEVTEWTNKEGCDVRISDVSGEKVFDLTWGQFKALKDCIKLINSSDEK